jgi:CHAT domain/SMODS-associated and fused to various effectors sensor domain
MSNSVRRILILTANPKKTPQMRVDEEVREIEAVLRNAKVRDQFDRPFHRPAVSPREMQSAIVEESPQIVHFSGHGEGEDGIILENEKGHAQFVTADALAGLFECCPQVECVVLDACYSNVQAKAIVQFVPCVIGMSRDIGDRAAIEFSRAFYHALGVGKSYREAYDLGCSGIRMMGIAESDIPQIYQKLLPDAYPSLRVHGWKKQAYANTATVELDWTKYFDKQLFKVPDATLWETELFPRLYEIRDQWVNTYVNRLIALHGTLPLTASLAIGNTFPQVGRYAFEVEQISGAASTWWRSQTPPSALKFKVAEQTGSDGHNLAIALSITRDAQPEVERFIQDSGRQFKTIVFAEVESGLGQTAIQSDADAIALANCARDLITSYRPTPTAKTHL